MTKYIIAHDVGTSADKALLVDVQGRIIESTRQEYAIYHPKPGYAEQDADEIFGAVCATTVEIVNRAGIEAGQVAGITFSSQVQSLIPIDKNGQALRRTMNWLDTRSAAILREKLWKPPRLMGYNPINLLRFIRITGGSPGLAGKDPIAKIIWLKEFEPEIFNNTYKFLDLKDYLIFRLTGNYVTSMDVAYVWWLMDTRKLGGYRWHEGLCSLAGITPDYLPELKTSMDIAGELTEQAAIRLELDKGIPVIIGSTDLASAAIGSGAIKNGQIHIRIGTSGGAAGHFSKRKIDLLHYTGCIGSVFPDKYYLGIGAQETAGLCLEWLKNHVLYHEEQLREEAHVVDIYKLLDNLAEKAPPGSEGLMFTPWMYGERCPINDDSVRAGFHNIGLNHNREHLIRAVLEGVAFNIRWALETLENLYQPVERVHAIGGGTKSDIWCRILADVTGHEILQTENPQEASARGMALLAWMALGYLDNEDDIIDRIKIQRHFTPNPENRSVYDKMFAEFKNIYKQNKSWYKRMNRG
ncbi:MAG: FGGY-family carbohydrate kinase [Calditrichaceae bacterium]|nr:FGGY-family carbohydrate kinase [Calditrichaceae bacterium]MBN2708865.1 FGGY-family carbohydrate kinase [Calditrichaceae bacterium]RQV97609.1 MAG: hypothetical protein EH224_00895 [Calditrichota bacterium]